MYHPVRVIWRKEVRKWRDEMSCCLLVVSLGAVALGVIGILLVLARQ